uniref:Uncharacterized protein n=1 Tax=Tanacetum cinerariifolium TaxID=118510 RepID=A0A699JUR0_TANCI|nr:hypothetical protein [Tanacetum cinerariifolium]
MTIEPHNWSSSAHQELHKIVKDENFSIVNQVDARVQNIEIQLLKEAAKFVGDFKSLANEADASLTKHKALDLEIERLLKAVVSQDIMNIVQKESVVDTSDLLTELERTKKHFENCIIKKENEYAKLWNDLYKKCDQCKYDKISYDKAYKDMQQKIERLQAQLGDLKGKCKDTSCVSDTRNPLSRKLENEIVELEFQVGKTNALSKPVTSNSVSTPQESKVVNNDKVIAPGLFRINPFKTYKEEKHVPNTGTNEGTGSRPGVPDVPSDDSEEELSWNSFDDKEGGEQTKGKEESEGDKTDESDDGSDDGNDDDDDETVKAGSESNEDDYNRFLYTDAPIINNFQHLCYLNEKSNMTP